MGGVVEELDLRGADGVDARAGSWGEERCRQGGGGEGGEEEEVGEGEFHFGGGFGGG